MSELSIANLGLGNVRVDGAQLGIVSDAAGTRYGDPAGLPSLREAVAAWRNADPSGVTITTGASQALVATLCTLPRPASVLVPRPWYSAYQQASELLGLEILAYELDVDRGWRISPESVAQSIREDTRALIVNQPHNPTGAISDAATLQAIENIARAAELVIISDETYSGIVFDGTTPPDIRSIFAFDRLVQIFSFSKLFGMPGERVGCVISDPAQAEAITWAHWALAMSAPASGQAMALTALRSGPDAHVEALVRTLGRNRERAIGILSECDALRFTTPAGGCFIWIEFPDCPVDSAAFARACRETAQVRVVPGHVFGVKSPVYVRASLAAPLDELTQGLTRLARLAGTLTTGRATPSLAVE